MAQPYLRGNRWYLKYKDASGRWQDRVCDARTKGQAVELLREIQVAEDRARNGLDKRPPRDGGGTVDAMVECGSRSSSRSAHRTRSASARSEGTSSVRRSERGGSSM